MHSFCSGLLSDGLTYYRVIDGMETLDRMERVPVDRKRRPEEPITVDRVTIHANPFADRDV